MTIPRLLHTLAGTAATLAALVFLAVPSAADAGEMCSYYRMGPGTYETKICEQADWLGDSTWRWDCRYGPPCRSCGFCHKEPEPAALRTFAVQSHLTRYASAMQAGEKIPWGAGMHLALIDGQRCIVGSDGKRLHCFPSNSLLLKNPKGEPVGVMTPPTRSPLAVPKVNPQ